MFLALILGAVIGYVLAIPPGPIGMASIRTGVNDGWRPAMKLAIGAGIFDLLYCALAMMATSAIVDMMDAWGTQWPLFRPGFQVLVVVLMIVFGVHQMRVKAPEARLMPSKRAGSIVSRAASHGPFFVGAGFAVANLANPTFIPSLAAMTAFVQKSDLYESTVLSNVAFSVGFGVGNVLWLFTLVRIVLLFRERMTPVFIKRIQQISGATLIGFGTFYGVRVLVITKWADLFRMAFAI
ncbi:MAG: LysE family transporter [Bacteroidetes bacterium]|nr:LysE family transporter [Bacteroidota bacterium]